MKLLLVGGSGMVGTLIAPYLRTAGHELRVLDVRPPAADGVEYVEGSIADADAVRRALDGCDSFVDVAMQGRQGGRVTDQNVELIVSNYTVNTLGLHLLLFLAQEQGIRFGVHTSTLSVHYKERPYFGQEELLPLDTPSVYGLTKALGEDVCAYFSRWFGMNLIALRITMPASREAYLAERAARSADYDGPTFALDEEDLARAYLAALDVVQKGRGRFDAVTISGDERELRHSMTKARQLLGWMPTSQRHAL